MKSKGKIAEGLFKKVLNNPSPGTFAHRFPDARTCRGRLPKQPADFLLLKNGEAFLIEIKELKKWPLPKSRITQVGKLLRWRLAGGRALILVYLNRAWYCHEFTELKSIYEDDCTLLANLNDIGD